MKKITERNTCLIQNGPTLKLSCNFLTSFDKKFTEFVSVSTRAQHSCLYILILNGNSYCKYYL